MAAGILAPCGADRIILRGTYDHGAARVSRADRLSEVVPVYAEPDQDVCGVDM